jgi:ribosomal protein S18 acetylase RimI-like enzyme
MRYGEVRAPSEELEGVAAWLPGNKADMNFWGLVRSGAVKYGKDLGLDLAKKFGTIFEPLKKDRKNHMHGTSYTYLQIIGVAPEFQGQGYGGRLLRGLIRNCEQAGLQIYLETETEENVAIYEKFDFRVLKQITLPVVELPMWEMVR